MPETNNALAIPISLFGNAVNSAGYILWKVAHVRQQAAAAKNPSPSNPPLRNCLFCKLPADHYLFTPLWWAGLILYGAGSSFHGFALSIGSMTVIAPMDSLTLVCNALFAPIILKEKFDRFQAVGTALIIVGIVGLALSSPEDPAEFDSTDSFGTYTEFKCISIWSIWGAVVFALYVLERLRFRNAQPDAQKDPDDFSAVHLTIVCFVAAYFAALCQLLLKSLFSLLAEGGKSFETFDIYVVFLLFLATDITMEIFRQRALRQFPALYVVPAISAMLLTGSVVLGGVCFKEFEALTDEEGMGFAIAIFLCIFGVVVLNSKELLAKQGGKKVAKLQYAERVITDEKL
ncbi:hypothetical protein TrVE_jg8246 [Triparma verrucosa]|uniref:Magnesium transporter n=1 Tax=Triparma verrucosa TaxID=1606542 RepID=A0A9W7EWA4_9STRA|nr:hypothetical protein TrVE_jg8246 [Triparma verrucosa]